MIENKLYKSCDANRIFENYFNKKFSEIIGLNIWVAEIVQHQMENLVAVKATVVAALGHVTK